MSVDFGKPRLLAVGVMISSDVSDEASNKRFEFGVPAEFCGVLLDAPSQPNQDRRAYLLS